MFGQRVKSIYIGPGMVLVQTSDFFIVSDEIYLENHCNLNQFSFWCCFCCCVRVCVWFVLHVVSIWQCCFGTHWPNPTASICYAHFLEHLFSCCFFWLIIICKRKLMFNISILFHLWNWNKEKYAVWKDCLTLKPYFEIMNTGFYFGSKPEKWTNCYSCFGYLMSRSILDEADHCMCEWRIELFPVVVAFVALFTFMNVKIRRKNMHRFENDYKWFFMVDLVFFHFHDKGIICNGWIWWEMRFNINNIISLVPF